MDGWIYWIFVPLSLSPFIYILWQRLYKEYIRPAKYYKLVILDQTEEYTFYLPKNKAVIIQDKKGFILFKSKTKDGELYCVSTDDETLPSKRDDFGTTTFYYWRNNSNPIRFKDSDEKGVISVERKDKKGKVVSSDKINSINNPLEVKIKEQIEIDNDASLLYKVYHTNILNSALMSDDKKIDNRLIYLIAGGALLITVFFLFKDQIVQMFGGG